MERWCVPAFEGWVPGTTPAERAVNLAGALAELGVTRLETVAPGGERTRLDTRGTDLPGLILSSPEGTELIAGDGVAHVRLEDAGLRWTTRDATVAERLR